MKEVSQMTAHELARQLLDYAEEIENPSDWAWVDQLLLAIREAAERLELGADGKGVGPTALPKPIKLAYVEARKRVNIEEAGYKAKRDYRNGSNENPYEADTAEWREYEQSFDTCCIEGQKQADAQPF